MLFEKYLGKEWDGGEVVDDWMPYSCQEFYTFK